MRKFLALLLILFILSNLSAGMSDLYDDGLRYYYPEMNEREQTLYRLLYDAVDGEDDDLQLKDNYTEKEIETIFSRMLEDSPELFHVAGRYSLTMNRSDGRVTSILFYYDHTGEKRRQLEKKILANAKKLVAGGRDFPRELEIHDNIASFITYRIDGTEESHTLVGALLNRSAVCDGYSKAFCLVSRLSGLRCGMVTGKLLDDRGIWQDHAWNIVRVKNVWTYVDVTADDQKGYISRAYFNLDQKMIERDHVMMSPELFKVDSADVNYFQLSGLVVPSDEKGMRRLFLNELNILNRKGAAVELAFSSQSDLYFFVSKYQLWIDEYNRDKGGDGFYGRYNYSVNDRQNTIRISQ